MDNHDYGLNGDPDCIHEFTVTDFVLFIRTYCSLCGYSEFGDPIKPGVNQ